MVSSVWRQTLPTASPLLFLQLCLFLQQGNIVMPGTPLFLILFFCTSHASVLAFCFFLPHVQRRKHHSKFGGVERRIASRQKRRLQTKSCFFILLFCFPDDYAIPGFRYLLLGHACPCKKLCCFVLFFHSLCTNHPILYHYSIFIYLVCLSVLPASLFWRGREGAETWRDQANQRRAVGTVLRGTKNK